MYWNLEREREIKSLEKKDLEEKEKMKSERDPYVRWVFIISYFRDWLKTNWVKMTI